jgi:toxin secretion/phage lysis holin
MREMMSIVESFRSWPAEGQLLVILVALQSLDIVTGVVAAYRADQMSSKVSWRGMARKALTLLAIATVAALQLASPHLPLPSQALLLPVITWFIAAEVLSICENLALGGVVSPHLMRISSNLVSGLRGNDAGDDHAPDQ